MEVANAGLVWRQERRSRPARGEGHGVWKLAVVVSCGGSGEKGWRTELQLGRGQSLDDHHRSATFGAAPKRIEWLSRGGLLCHRCGWNPTQGLEAKGQNSSASPVRQEAKVADADEAFGQQVQQEAAQELIQL